MASLYIIYSSVAARTKKSIVGIRSYDIKRYIFDGCRNCLNVVKYDGVSNFSYEYFDIKDKQKIKCLELVSVYVPVCLVSF